MELCYYVTAARQADGPEAARGVRHGSGGGLGVGHLRRSHVAGWPASTGSSAPRAHLFAGKDAHYASARDYEAKVYATVSRRHDRGSRGRRDEPREGGPGDPASPARHPSPGYRVQGPEPYLSRRLPAQHAQPFRPARGRPARFSFPAAAGAHGRRRPQPALRPFPGAPAGRPGPASWSAPPTSTSPSSSRSTGSIRAHLDLPSISR